MGLPLDFNSNWQLSPVPVCGIQDDLLLGIENRGPEHKSKRSELDVLLPPKNDGIQASNTEQ